MFSLLKAAAAAAVAAFACRPCTVSSPALHSRQDDVHFMITRIFLLLVTAAATAAAAAGQWVVLRCAA
jgi:hypothetical protein